MQGEHYKIEKIHNTVELVGFSLGVWTLEGFCWVWDLVAFAVGHLAYELEDVSKGPCES